MAVTFEAGFAIEAVFSLPWSSGVNQQTKPSWPWDWTGKEAVVPSLRWRAAATTREPVYCLRVRGTSDLELVYEIVQPDGDTDIFPVALRRQIGLVRLSGDDRNDRDLRLRPGLRLDRLLSDKGLRSRLVSELTKNDVKNELAEDERRFWKLLIWRLRRRVFRADSTLRSQVVRDCPLLR